MPPLADLIGEPATPETFRRAQYEVNRIALEMEQMGSRPPALNRGVQGVNALTNNPIPVGITGTAGATTTDDFCLINGTIPGNMAVSFATTMGTAASTLSTMTITVPAMGIDATPLLQAMMVAVNNVCSITSNVTMTNTGALNVQINQVWNQWNASYAINNACTAVTGGTYAMMDNEWGGRTNYAQLLADRVAWGVWNDRYEVITEAKAEAQFVQRYSRRRLSEAELVAELKREKEERRLAEERAAKLKNAEANAEKLLRTCLSHEQLEDLDKKRCFYVVVDGRVPGKKEKYRIDRDNHQVKQLDEKGSIIRSFCIYTPGVPQPDTVLAQKLFLEASEETREQFWETANISDMVAEKAVPFSIPRRERRRYAVEHGLLH